MSAVATLAVVVPTTTAHAALKSWKAKVTYVSDGDTFDAKLKATGEVITVRVAGMNTTETGRCWADKAKTKLKRLVGGKTVTLMAENESSKVLGRPYRYVHTPKGVDVTAKMLKGGFAVPFPNAQEPARSKKYAKLAQVAQNNQRRIWDSDACRSGPRQSANLTIQLMWDADNNDEKNLNGEWIRVINNDSRALSMKNWKLRDSSNDFWTFPSSFKLGAGKRVTVHVGSGTNSSKHLYMRQDRSLFTADYTKTGKWLGDGAYLVDPHGDIRRYSEYPCVSNCTDPIGSKIDLSAQFDAPGTDTPNTEWINIKNVSSSTVNLRDYVLRTRERWYVIEGYTPVAPGERFRLHVGSGTDSNLRRYWGWNKSIFGDQDWVTLQNFAQQKAKTFKTPCTTCPVPNVNISGAEVDPPGSDQYGGEWVTIRNDGSSNVSIMDWIVKSNSKVYYLPSRTLAPGATITVHGGNGTDSGNDYYWGKGYLFTDTGGSIALYTQHRVRADCHTWGGASCTS